MLTKNLTERIKALGLKRVWIKNTFYHQIYRGDEKILEGSMKDIIVFVGDLEYENKLKKGK